MTGLLREAVVWSSNLSDPPKFSLYSIRAQFGESLREISNFDTELEQGQAAQYLRQLNYVNFSLKCTPTFTI